MRGRPCSLAQRLYIRIMRLIGFALLVLLSAVQFLAIGAGTEAHAGGAGHSQGHEKALEVSTSPDRGGGMGIALPGPKGLVVVAEDPGISVNLEKASVSDTPPCGGEHTEGGKGCCGVACHAAMSQNLVDTCFVEQASLTLRPIGADCRDGHPAFSIERPPRV